MLANRVCCAYRLLRQLGFLKRLKLGYVHVVDADLKSYFDTIDHTRLRPELHRLRKRIRRNSRYATQTADTWHVGESVCRAYLFKRPIRRKSRYAMQTQFGTLLRSRPTLTRCSVWANRVCRAYRRLLRTRFLKRCCVKALRKRKPNLK